MPINTTTLLWTQTLLISRRWIWGRKRDASRLPNI